MSFGESPKILNDDTWGLWTSYCSNHEQVTADDLVVTVSSEGESAAFAVAAYLNDAAIEEVSGEWTGIFSSSDGLRGSIMICCLGQNADCVEAKTRPSVYRVYFR